MVILLPEVQITITRAIGVMQFIDAIANVVVIFDLRDMLWA